MVTNSFGLLMLLFTELGLRGVKKESAALCLLQLPCGHIVQVKGMKVTLGLHF